MVFHHGEVFEEPAKGERGSANTGLQPFGTETICLPAKGGAQTLKRPNQVLGLSTGKRRFPRAVVVSHGLHVLQRTRGPQGPRC